MFHNVCSAFHEVSCFTYYRVSSISVTAPLPRESGRPWVTGCRDWTPVSRPVIPRPPLSPPPPARCFPRLQFSSQFLSLSGYLPHCLVAIYSLDFQLDFRFPRGHVLFTAVAPTPSTCCIWPKVGIQEIVVGWREHISWHRFLCKWVMYNPFQFPILLCVYFSQHLWWTKQAEALLWCTLLPQVNPHQNHPNPILVAFPGYSQYYKNSAPCFLGTQTLDSKLFQCKSLYNPQPLESLKFCFVFTAVPSLPSNCSFLSHSLQLPSRWSSLPVDVFLGQLFPTWVFCHPGSGVQVALHMNSWEI